jgi:hypothetical protein
MILGETQPSLNAVPSDGENHMYAIEPGLGGEASVVVSPGLEISFDLLDIGLITRIRIDNETIADERTTNYLRSILGTAQSFDGREVTSIQLDQSTANNRLKLGRFALLVTLAGSPYSHRNGDWWSLELATEISELVDLGLIDPDIWISMRAYELRNCASLIAKILRSPNHHADWAQRVTPLVEIGFEDLDPTEPAWSVFESLSLDLPLQNDDTLQRFNDALRSPAPKVPNQVELLGLGARTVESGNETVLGARLPVSLSGEAQILRRSFPAAWNRVHGVLLPINEPNPVRVSWNPEDGVLAIEVRWHDQEEASLVGPTTGWIAELRNDSGLVDIVHLDIDSGAGGLILPEGFDINGHTIVLAEEANFDPAYTAAEFKLHIGQQWIVSAHHLHRMNDTHAAGNAIDMAYASLRASIGPTCPKRTELREMLDAATISPFWAENPPTGDALS